MSSEGVLAAIAAAESKLGSNGRVLVRKSGTEPVVRVMAEADDLGLIDTVIADIVGAMHEARL
jgi:phosphoglucosamine mutase